MAAKKMPAKKMTAKPKTSDADARKEIAKGVNEILASGNAMKNYPTAKSLMDVLPDTLGEGSLRPKIGDKKFYSMANAEAKKAHARLKKAAARGDVSRAVLEPATRTMSVSASKKAVPKSSGKSSGKTMPVSMKKKKSK
jgi:hypothetical protein